MTFEIVKDFGEVVGASGFEPPTPRSRTECSTRLSHAPTSVKAYSSPHRRLNQTRSYSPMIAGWRWGAAVLLLCGARAAAAQDAPAPPHEDTRTQYPALLVNSYFSVDVGSISYPFSQRQLEPGLQAASIRTPHPAARIALVGHEFNRYLSAQLTYMRPVRYVTYTDVDGDATAHHVWTHFGGMTARLGLPIAARLSVYGEAGLGITSRDGFNRSDGAPVVRSAHYASWLAGAGVDRQNQQDPRPDGRRHVPRPAATPWPSPTPSSSPAGSA